MRTGIFGGTFDPIHRGHLAIATAACDALALERIIFIPAYQQPFKTRAQSAAPEHRLAMTCLAAQSDPRFSVSDIELQRSCVSYTIETLEALYRPETSLFLLVGADAALELPRWQRPTDLARYATIVVIQRPGSQLDLTQLLRALPALDGHMLTIEGPRLDISSTDIRQRVALQQPFRHLVPAQVGDYIAQHQLYCL